MTAVELDGVTKRYGSVVAVEDLTLDVAAGEFFALLGPSGCGKTSTLRMIAGFEVPMVGRIRLDGQDVTALRPHRRPVNTVFQSYALFPHLTVFDNVAYGPRRRAVRGRELAEQVGDMLELVQLDDVARRRPHELSGGQQQRVALARALINRPKVLLLDEPLGALDLSLRRAMQLELKRIQRDVGITFVHVTHDQEEAMTMADRIAVMRTGRIEQLGEPVELYSRPRTEFVAGFLGRSNLLDGEMWGWSEGSRVGIRPERVQLVPALAGSSASEILTLEVTVADRAFMGTSTQFVAVTAWGQELVAVTQDPPDLRPGDAGQLRWERGHMFVLDAVGPVTRAAVAP